jgi:hypothetical protein
MKAMSARFAKKFFGRLGGWIGVNLVQDVPEDIAACEFDCSKPTCEGPDLVTCERRMRAEAAEQRVRTGASDPPSECSERTKPAV